MFRKVKFPEQVAFRIVGEGTSETPSVEGTANGMGHCRVVLCLGQHGGWLPSMQHHTQRHSCRQVIILTPREPLQNLNSES